MLGGSNAASAISLHGRSRLELLHVATRDVFELHSREEYAGATFMAASQFNCLEAREPRRACT